MRAAEEGHNVWVRSFTFINDFAVSTKCSDWKVPLCVACVIVSSAAAAAAVGDSSATFSLTGSCWRVLMTSAGCVTSVAAAPATKAAVKWRTGAGKEEKVANLDVVAKQW